MLLWTDFAVPRGGRHFLADWGLAGGIARQQPDSSVIRVDVREVLVPVIVTDGKGHHVTGLKGVGLPHFRGRRRTGGRVVRHRDSTIRKPGSRFGYPATRTSTGISGSGARIDRAHVRHLCGRPAFRIRRFGANAEALTRLFEKEKASGAQYVLLSIGQQLRVLQAATGDPAAVLTKLRNPQFQPAFGGGDAAALRAELNDLKSRMYDFCRGCDCTSSRDCNIQAQDLKLKLDGQAEHWALLRGQFLAQLKSVVEELAKLPTGRTLILVSDGFSLQPAREFYAVAAAFLPKDERFKTIGPTDLESTLQSVIKVAAERNVRVYAVDSRGLSQASFASNGSMDASAPANRTVPSVIRRVPDLNRGGTLLADMDHEAGSVAFQNGSGMEQLARATGGIYFHDSNDLLKEFRSVLADGREYYVLAYVPRNRVHDGKFRRIAVELADKKLHVRAKSGYWADAAPN